MLAWELKDDNRSNGEDVNIVLAVRDNEHSLMCPTDRGNDPTVDSYETEKVDRERGRDGNGQLHGNQWTLVQNPRRAWKKGNRVINDRLVYCKSVKLTISGERYLREAF
jgi:hypothetical protein